MTPTVHQLRVFATVVDCGSFTRAAEVLYLTQPAVTFQVRQLEQQVGTPLFVREGRRVVPTTAGFAVYRYASDVLASTDLLQHELDAIASGEEERIVVGAGPAYSAFILPELLARFHRAHPRVRLALQQTSGSAAAVVQDLRGGRIDIGMAMSARPLRDGLVAAYLGTDEPIVVESTRTPISTNGCMTLAQIAQAPFIRNPAGHGQLSTMLDRLLAAQGLGPPSFVMEMSVWDGVKHAVRSGAGLALVLWAVVREEVTSGEFRVVQVEGYRDPHEVYLLTRPRTGSLPTSPTVRALLAFLATEAPGALYQDSSNRGVST